MYVDILQLLNLPGIPQPIHVHSYFLDMDAQPIHKHSHLFSKTDAQNYFPGGNLSPKNKCHELEILRNAFALHFKHILYKAVCKTQEHTFQTRNKKANHSKVMSQQLMHC